MRFASLHAIVVQWWLRSPGRRWTVPHIPALDNSGYSDLFSFKRYKLILMLFIFSLYDHFLFIFTFTSADFPNNVFPDDLVKAKAHWHTFLIYSELKQDPSWRFALVFKDHC